MASNPRVISLKKSVISEIDKQKEYLVGISRFIHSHPEANYEEYECSKYLADCLKRLGFEVEIPVAGVQTAFRAKLSSSKTGPTVCILAEYDALSITDESGKSHVVHACGHNLNSAAAVGAALGLRSLGAELPGSIVVLGTPAEEGGGGKVALLEGGAFSDVDVVLTVHGDQRDWYTIARSCTCSTFLEIEFTGERATTVGKKQEFVSSLDALTLFLNSLNMIEYHITRDTLIQRKLVPSQQATNATAYKSKLEVQIRSGDEEYLTNVEKRVRNAAQGVALAVGARFTIEKRGYPYERIIENKTLEEVGCANIEFLAHKFTYDEMSPYPFGTDTGNVSHRIPTLQFLIGRPEGFNFHTMEAVQQSVSPSAHSMMIDSAKILACTAIDILLDEKLPETAKRELESYQENGFAGLYSWHEA